MQITLFIQSNCLQKKASFKNCLNCEKSYILIGDSQCTLDFINYQDCSYLFKSEFEIEERLRPHHSPPRNNLYFEPPTSSEDSDCSDYTDYWPITSALPELIGCNENVSRNLPPFITGLFFFQTTQSKENLRNFKKILRMSNLAHQGQTPPYQEINQQHQQGVDLQV